MSTIEDQLIDNLKEHNLILKEIASTLDIVLGENVFCIRTGDYMDNLEICSNEKDAIRMIKKLIKQNQSRIEISCFKREKSTALIMPKTD